MGLLATTEVPTLQGTITLQVSSGSSIVFVGANGAGKTRLGVLMNQQFSQTGLNVHRIAAHRSLLLNPAVVAPSVEIANNRLFYGLDQGGFQNQHGHRYQGKPETALLSDFDHVLAALYADNTDVSIEYRQTAIALPGISIVPPSAKIDKLKQIWEKVLPHRELIVLGGNLKTKTLGGQEYSASDMSDGERVTFYLIAQALLVKPDTLLIFDEPELHINRSILAKLWDAIESARPDCCFVYITHDIEFAGSRHAATKYVLRSYQKVPTEAWDIELVPEESEMPDDVVVTIVGSRQPILFTEGDGGSLDSALYRRVYDQYTVIPVGSCDKVIATVAAFCSRPELHRVGCAGILDADGRTNEEASFLAAKGVYCLPVSEVENLLLIPPVFLALAAELKFSKQDSISRLAALKIKVFKLAYEQIDAVCLRYTRRRVDAEMKKIDLSGADVYSLSECFEAAASGVDTVAIFERQKSTLTQAIVSEDYEKVLLHFDNKGLLTEVAKLLGYQHKSLEEFVGRALRSDEDSQLYTAFKNALPIIIPRP